MFKNSKFKIIGLVTTLMIAMILSACGSGSSEENSSTDLGGKEIEIPYKGDNSAARSLVIAEVLKDVGYDVVTTPVPASGPLYSATSENSNSFNAAGIFPSTDKSYLNKYDNLEVYDDKNIIDEANVSLAVPKYMKDVDSIDDLKNDNDLGKSVDWTITGTDNRNGVMKETNEALKDNDFSDWKLDKSSDEEMLKTIQEKYKKQQPIIFTGTQPHWIFEEMDFKMLDDPDKIYGSGKEHVNLVFNKNFKNNHPAAYKIATRIANDWNEDDEKALSKKIYVDNEDPQKVAEDYVNNHESKKDKWTEGIKEN